MITQEHDVADAPEAFAVAFAVALDASRSSKVLLRF